MNCNCNQYELPTICFVGGGNQEFEYEVFYLNEQTPFDVTSCRARFSVVSCTNKYGTPVVSKDMIASDDDTNKLSVTLTAQDTVNLNGKYYYQIYIVDEQGNAEPPCQGVMYVRSNIDKSFIAS